MAQRRRRVNKNLIMGLTFAGMLLLGAAGLAGILALRQRDPQVWRENAQSFLDQGDLERATKSFMRAYAHSADPQDLLAAAEVLVTVDQPQQAMDLMRRALADPTAGPEVMQTAQRRLVEVQLGLPAFAQGSTSFWKRVLADAEGLLELDPQSSVGYRGQGAACMRLSHLDPAYVSQARQALERALELDPTDIGAAEFLWQAYFTDCLTQADPEPSRQKAEHLCASLQNRLPDDPELAASWGMVCVRFAGDLITESNLLAGGRPTRSRYNQAELAQLIEEYKAKGKEALDQAIRLRSDHARTFFYLASYHLLAGEADSALEAYRKAIEVEPDSLEYYYRLGRLLSLTGKLEEAEKLYKTAWEEVKIQRSGYRQAINRFYRHAVGCRYAVIMMRNVAELDAEQQQELIAQLRGIVEQAVGELRRDTWRTLDVKGRLAALEQKTLEALSFTKQAEEACRLTEDTAVDKTELLIRLSRLYNLHNRSGLAEKKMVEALRLRPDIASLWAELADLRNKNQNPEGALDAAAEALRREPENIEAKRAQLSAHQRLGNTQEVQRLIAELGTQDVESKLRQALAYLTDEKADLAEAELRKALEMNPTHRSAIELLVLLLVQQERRDDALAVVQNALDKDPENIDLERLIPMLREEDPAKRDQLVREVLEKETDPFRKALRLAQFSIGRQDWEQAKAHLDQAEEIHPQETLVIERQFTTSLASGDWKRAESYARKAGALNIDGAQGRFYVGRLAMAQRKFQDATQAFGKGLELSPSDPDGRTWLGVCLLATNRTEQATREFEAVLEISPSHGLANRSLAQIYKRRFARTRDPADNEKLEQHLEVARAAMPQDAWVRQEVRLQEEEEDPEAAVARREELRRADPTDLENLSRLAELHERVAVRALGLAKGYSMAGQPERVLAQQQKAAQCRDQAVAILREAVDANPQNMSLVLDTAHYLRRVGRVDEAETLLHQALEGAEGDLPRAQAYIMLGIHFERLGNFEKAESNYMQAIEATHRQDVAVLMDVANFMLRQKRSRDQAKFLAEARDLHSAGPDQQKALHRRLINLLLQLEDTDQAGGEIKSYLDEYPNDAQGLMFRGVLNRLLGQIESAIADFSTVIERQPTSAIAFLERGRIYFDQSRWDRAISDLEKTKAIAPHGYEYQHRIQLASALFFSHKPDQAVSELKSIIEDAGNVTPTLAVVTLSDFYHRLGRYDDERGLLVEQSRQHPKDATWLVMLAQAARAQGQTARAAQLLAQATQLSGNDPRVLDLQLSSLLRSEQPGQVLAVVANLPQEARYPGIEQRLGQAYAQLGQTAQALEQFERQLRYYVGSLEGMQPVIYTMTATLGPDPVIEHFRQRVANTPPPNLHEQLLLAIALRAGNKLQESTALAKQLATADAPEQQRANFVKFLALLLSESNQYEEACKLFEEVLRIRPNDAASLNNLAYTKAERLGQPEEALPYARRALELLPKEANVLDTVGWTCHLANRPVEEAIGYLLRAIRENAELVAAHYHLGEVYVKRGDQAEAEQHLERALELSEEQRETEFRESIIAALRKLGVAVP